MRIDDVVPIDVFDVSVPRDEEPPGRSRRLPAWVGAVAAAGAALGLLALAVVTEAGSAADPAPMTTVTTPALIGGAWRIVGIVEHGHPVPVPNVDQDAYLQFDVIGTVAGFDGCNGFGGPARIAGDRVVIGPVASSQVTCPAEHVNQIDDLLTQGAARWGVMGGLLQIKGEQVSLIYRRGPAIPVSAD
jgi:heat shock protein HslJ